MINNADNMELYLNILIKHGLYLASCICLRFWNLESKNQYSDSFNLCLYSVQFKVALFICTSFLIGLSYNCKLINRGVLKSVQ